MILKKDQYPLGILLAMCNETGQYNHIGPAESF